MIVQTEHAARADTFDVARASALLVLGQAIGTGFSFIRTTITAKSLGPNGFGMAVVLMAYPDLVWSACRFKSADVTTAYISQFRHERRHDLLLAAAGVGCLSDLLAAIVALIVVALTASWVGDQALAASGTAGPMILYAACFPATSLLTTSFAVLTAYERFKLLSLLQVLSSVLQLVFVSILLWANFGGPGVALGIGAAQALTGVAGFLAAGWALKQDPLFTWKSARLELLLPIGKQMSKAFGWNFAVLTLRGPVEQLPVLVLSSVSGPAAAGYYKLASSVAGVARYVEAALGRTSFPKLSIGTKGCAQDVRRLVSKWSLQLGLPCAAVLLLGLPLVPFLVVTIFGDQYIPMTTGLLYLLGATALSVIVFWIQPLYYSCGKIDFWAKGYALYSAVTAGGVILVAQSGGFTAAALVLALGNAAFVTGMAIFSLRSKWLTEGPIAVSGSTVSTPADV